MSQNSSAPAAKPATEQVVRDIRCAPRKHHSAEDKIRVVLGGLRGEDRIAALCRREGIAESLYYAWSKEFLEAGKRRLAGDTARAATTDEVKELRQEARTRKEVVAEQALELRLLKKNRTAKLAGMPAVPAWPDRRRGRDGTERAGFGHSSVD
jgi:transposase